MNRKNNFDNFHQTLDDNICQYQSKNLYIYIANIIKYALFSIGQLSEKNTEYENMRIQRF